MPAPTSRSTSAPRLPTSSRRSASAMASACDAARCWCSSTMPRRAPTWPRREAAVTESESQYNRSRELLNTQACRNRSFDQLEATLKANRARLASAQRAPRRHRDPRAVFRPRGFAARERGHAHQSRRCHHHAGRHQRHQARFLGAGKFPVDSARGTDGARHRAGVPGPHLHRQGRQHRFARRHEHALGHRARAARQRGRRAQARHVPQRGAGQRRARDAGHSRGGADAGSRAAIRVRGRRRQGAAARSAHRRRAGRAASKYSPASAPGEQVVVEGTQKVRDGAAGDAPPNRGGSETPLPMATAIARGQRRHAGERLRQ